jgi:hypothetical protein
MDGAYGMYEGMQIYIGARIILKWIFKKLDWTYLAQGREKS